MSIPPASPPPPISGENRLTCSDYDVKSSTGIKHNNTAVGWYKHKKTKSRCRK